MTRRVLLSLASATLMLMLTSSANAQSLYIWEDLETGWKCWYGSYEYYPPAPRYANRYHGPSLYANYGVKRLDGRILALPAGFSPPGPQAIDRFTIGRVEPGPPLRVVPTAPTYSSRYGHPSYIRSYQRSRYSSR